MTQWVERHFQELGRIVVVYAVLQIIYAVWLGQTPSYELIKEMPGWLKPRELKDKISIVQVFVYVMIATLPLMISALWMTISWRNERSVVPFMYAVAVPFGIYTILKPDLLPKWVPGQPIPSAESLPQFVWRALTFYFNAYKLPLFVTSILFGVWAGVKLSPVSKGSS